jgi:hypothetical protein
MYPLSTSRGKQMYFIAYSYEFRNRSQVEIEGLGLVGAVGRFDYVTREISLRIRDVAGGSTITVPLKPTRPPEGGTMELPEESSFKKVFLGGVWKGSTPFREHLEEVLTRWFAGYLPQPGHQLTYYMTAYRRMEGLPNRRIGEVALLISFPYTLGKNQTVFHVQSVLRHKAILSSDWKTTVDTNVASAAQSFVKRIIEELQAP